MKSKDKKITYTDLQHSLFIPFFISLSLALSRILCSIMEHDFILFQVTINLHFARLQAVLARILN
jgi:hypothetical protein